MVDIDVENWCGSSFWKILTSEISQSAQIDHNLNTKNQEKVPYICSYSYQESQVF